MVDAIDPNHFISHGLYRDQCFTRENRYIKDLRVVNRKLSNCLLLDDNITSFTNQKDNGIPILNFQGDPNDRELMKVCNFMMSISSLDDVRIAIREEFKMEALYQEFLYKTLRNKK